MKPQKVQQAVFARDTAALSRMGRAGGKAAAAKRAEKRLIDEAFQERKLEEVREVIAERGGDPQD